MSREEEMFPEVCIDPFCAFTATVSFVTVSFASIEGTKLSSNDAFFELFIGRDIERKKIKEAHRAIE